MSFPLRFPDDDPRFSSHLLDDISAVLINHGYPWVDGDDTAFADLRAALAGFLYGPAFNAGDKVSWVDGELVRSGHVDTVANGSGGQVARIITDPQPGYVSTFIGVVPCRELTPVRDGAK